MTCTPHSHQYSKQHSNTHKVHYERQPMELIFE
jgi:hypothetical protein